MAFNLPFYSKLSKLYVKCQNNPATNKTGWYYKKPDQVKVLEASLNFVMHTLIFCPPTLLVTLFSIAKFRLSPENY